MRGSMRSFVCTNTYLVRPTNSQFIHQLRRHGALGGLQGVVPDPQGADGGRGGLLLLVRRRISTTMTIMTPPPGLAGPSFPNTPRPPADR